MSTAEYLEQMKKIQESILVFLEDSSNSEESFENLNIIFIDQQVREDPHELKAVLRLLMKITKNYHRGPNFFSKIERIILNFKDEIKKFFSNSDIFNIFKGNKRILLFLSEEKLLIFDRYVVTKIVTSKNLIKYKYPQYFQPEIKPFINEKWFPKNDPNSFNLNLSFENSFFWVQELMNEIPKSFYEDRKSGENENFICRLIQKDLIKEFIAFTNQNNYSLRSTIQPSNFETNSFLIKKQQEINQLTFNSTLQSIGISLIEYATFYGSIQIFNYLKLEGVELTPSLWLYAIHGQNAEIVHILEDNDVKPQYDISQFNFNFNVFDPNNPNPNQNSNSNQDYKECLFESIKCHHNDFANFFLNNYLKIEDADSRDVFLKSLQFHNFAFIQNDKINQSSFYELCQYDYFSLVKILLDNKDIDVNAFGI